MLLAVNTIKILIVDDSAIVRKILSQQLSVIDGIEVVGSAPDPIVAMNKISKLNPDVIILDVEMPRMDGITFLNKIMQTNPMPVIVFSSVTPQGGKNALVAIDAGAVDVMVKPGASYTVGDACRELGDKIKAASKAKVERRISTERRGSSGFVRLTCPVTTNKIFAIGASTGGVQALTTVLTRFPPNAPGTLVVQHMPANFTKSFAERLNGLCSMEVKEAQDGDRVIPGKVLIAPGGFHMTLQRSGMNFYVSVKDGPLVCRQKPSVETLFNSVAQCAGPNAVAAILTGMGDDGATGMLNIKNQGAHTIAQDQHTSTVFGMPKEAIEKGAAEKIAPLNDIARLMIQFASR